MLCGQMPLHGVQKGQRWFREDPCDNSKIILEITHRDDRDVNAIKAIVVQTLKGSAPCKSNDHWTGDLKESPCYYTYLPGQDNPS